MITDTKEQSTKTSMLFLRDTILIMRAEMVDGYFDQMAHI